MIRLLLLLSLVAAPAAEEVESPPSTAAARALEPGDHVRSVAVAGTERTYLLHVPPSYEPGRPTPVVLAFHGAAMSGSLMVRFTGLSAKADEAGFLAVYPNGTGFLGLLRTFNAGTCCGSAARNGVDDVAFTRLLLEDLASAVNVDPDRVFATGMSNGAMMVYRVASELSDRIAAIAPVGGPMAMAPEKLERPVPVVHFHGTEDRFADFDGRAGEQMAFSSVDGTVSAWRRANGCGPDPVTEELPDEDDDGTRVLRMTWSDGCGGAEVVLYRIEGGGHTWPGGTYRPRFLGVTTREVDANDVMWEFFLRHPRVPAGD